MSTPRVQALAAKLEKGKTKTLESFRSLTMEQWTRAANPADAAGPDPWTWRDLLAHFVSTEREFLRLCQDVAAGGPGAPEGYRLDEFNAVERERWRHLSPAELLAQIETERNATLAWVRTLDDAALDRAGHHPVLGQVNLESMLLTIYAHQLLHMRELQPTEESHVVP